MNLVTSGGGVTFGPMGTRRTETRLTQVSGRLRELRDELAMIDEQLAHLVDDAEDLALRALVAETPAASFESNDARKHVDAMRRHRQHVVDPDRRAGGPPGRAARPPDRRPAERQRGRRR